jgi:hypothetical protein
MKKIFQCFNFQKKYYCGFILIIIFTVVLYFFPGLFIATGDILNKYSEAIIALSAILGVLFGSSWLDTSKKKMKGKLDYDIARKYLKGVLKLRDAIKIVRNPFIPVGEMQSALEKNGFKGDEYENKEKVNRSVYSLRWNKVQEAWTNLEEILTEAEISWGDEAVKIQNDLDKLVRELRSVIWLFVNYSDSFHKQYDKNSKLLYGSYDTEDVFSVKVDAEINKIRDFLKRYL